MSFHVPTLPKQSVLPQITPAQREAAQKGVSRNGHRISLTLKVLIAISVILNVVTMFGVWWLLSNIPVLVQPLHDILGTTLNEKDWATSMVWLKPLQMVLIFIASAIAVWGIWLAHQAINQIQNYTLQPNQENATALSKAARSVWPWLTFGQWTPMISLVLNFILVIALAFFTQAETSNIFMSIITGFFSAAIQALPGILINWFIYAAIKNWLAAIITRSHTPNFPVRPFARPVDGWFMFVMIWLGFGAFSLVISGLLCFFGPSFIQTMLSNNLGSTKDGAFSTVFTLFLTPLMKALGIFILLLIPIYILDIFLIAWSRQFALDVAHVLDANASAAPAANPVNTAEW